jgi:hypothetical protein
MHEVSLERGAEMGQARKITVGGIMILLQAEQRTVIE